MKAKEIYEKETGNKQPTNQIAYYEWYIEYVNWLEQKVEELFDMSSVNKQRELLRAYHIYLLKHTDKEECNHTIEEFLIAHNHS